MKLLLFRATARHLIRHPWQLSLALLGIALGVAVVCAVQVTQASARQALRYAQASLLGPATHRIVAATDTFDESDYAALALKLPEQAFAPMVLGTVETASPERLPLQLIGIDPLSELVPGAAAKSMGHGPDLARFLSEPGAILTNPATAGRLGLRVGTALTIRVGASASRLILVGIAPAPADGGPADDMLIADIATAQEVLGLQGRLSALETRVGARHRRQDLGVLRHSLPVGWQLESNTVRLASATEMTRAFDVNLTALSLLALLVGMFLIYNTAGFLVLQRQSLFTRLRSLGVSRHELLSALLAEALAIGLAGSLLGVLFGRLIAGQLLAMVGRTVNDLYYRAAITEVVTPSWLLIGMLTLGIAATVLAALPPILAVTRATVVSVRPTAELGVGQHRLPALIATLALVASGLLAWWPTRLLLPGFAALFAFLLACSALLPWLLATVAARASRMAERMNRPAFMLAMRFTTGYGHRLGIAAAALMTACATGIAITVMIASFRISVTEWLATLLRADVYIAQDARATRVRQSLADVRAQIAELPEVAASSTVTRSTVRSRTSSVQLLAYELPPAARRGFQFTAGQPSAAWSDWEDADIVIVTEPFAFRYRLQPGDTLTLQAPTGPVNFRVMGVYRDYASERGSVALSLSTYTRHFAPRDIDGIGVYGTASISSTELQRALRRTLGARRDLQLQSNADLRRRSLDVFDRTFAVTEVLRTLALGVAFIGIVSALLAQQMERLPNYGLARALGFSRPELMQLVLLQTAVVGAVAATAAVPVGLVLAVILIDVINLRSFGWTMTLHIPWLTIIEAWTAAIAAACLAGAYPAWLVARLSPASVMRND